MTEEFFLRVVLPGLLLTLILFVVGVAVELASGGLHESDDLTAEEYRYLCGLKIEKRDQQRRRIVLHPRLW